MMEKLWEELGKLAEATGVAVEKLYVILEQQAKVQLVWNILFIIGIIVAIVAGILLSKYFSKKAKEGGAYNEWDIPMVICSATTAIFGFIGLFFTIPKLVREIVQIVVNPPVWILEYVMNLIK